MFPALPDRCLIHAQLCLHTPQSAAAALTGMSVEITRQALCCVARTCLTNTVLNSGFHPWREQLDDEHI